MRNNDKKMTRAWYTSHSKVENFEKKKPTRSERMSTQRVNTLRPIAADFILGSPSLLSGLARLVDFGCAFDAYNYSETPEEADTRAMLADWLAVGFDISDAIEKLESEKERDVA